MLHSDAPGMLFVGAVFGLVVVFGASSSGCRAPGTQPRWAELAGPVTPWPRNIPARVRPDASDAILVTTLGDVQTPLADAMFDPLADRVTLTDGTIIERFYQERLEIPYYRPIDKSSFPVPPSGWCSWYYYYQEIDADEVLANARWIAKHLKPYGARYVQIDDGWQGTGHGAGENRDWTTIDARFRQSGMDRLASEIRELGLEAGLWLAPHGQSNERVARGFGAFLWKADGTTASNTWEGTYLVDPSIPNGSTYLRDLFRTLRGWGYTYFKIDGQPIVLEEYAKTIGLMSGAGEAVAPAPARATALYRSTLAAIREEIGPDTYLLGCWGIPLPGIGIMNGSRTGGDIVQGRDGFLIAAKAVQEWNFLHNIAWYCDPDVMMVRPPLADGVARSWATIMGLTGQALLTSDRLPDLPPSRVELLKRIYPAVDIRPLDLARLSGPLKPIWDLKVVHLGRAYDVVGLFNFDDRAAETRHVRWADLGLEPDRKYHVYDFWAGTYLGAWDHGVFVEVPPADVRVITLIPVIDRPVLLSTSRHITQGWVDLVALDSGKDGSGPIVRGRSRVIAGDPYTLTVGLPPGEPTFRLAEVSVSGNGPVRTVHLPHQGYATVRIESDRTQEVAWELRFLPAKPYVFPARGPEKGKLNVTPLGTDRAEVSWPAPYHSQAAYRVSVDGTTAGYAFHNRAVLDNLTAGQPSRIRVQAVWYDGSSAEEGAEVEYTHQAPAAATMPSTAPAG